MAERTRGWENRRPVRSILIRPSCSAGARVCAPGPETAVAAALRSGPSATAASSSAACAGSGRAANREVRTAVSRSVRGSGSAAHRRLAAGSSAITVASSISAIGLPAAWASTWARARPRGGRGCPSSRRPASAADSGSRCSSGKPRSKPGGGAWPRAPTSSTTRSASRRLPAKASASSELRSSQWASSATTRTGDRSDKIRQQGQDGHPGQQRVRSAGVRSQAERPGRARACRPGRPGGAGQHRPQQLMQPGEREPGLRFPAGDRQHPHARRPGPAGGVGQEHGLAHPRLAGDQQDLAGLRDRIHQRAQPGQPGVPADDAARAAVRGVHRDLACACPLGQCVSSTPSPRPTATAARACPQRAKCSHPAIPPAPPGATVRPGQALPLRVER